MVTVHVDPVPSFVAPAPTVTAEPLSLGVLGRTRKEGERRLPIHPAHVARIDPALRAELKNTRPLSVLMSEQVNALREWASARTVPVATPT